MTDQYPNALAVNRGANYFGIQSGGVWQLRGNGTFVLNRDEIYFIRWLIKKEIRIPIRQIVSIEMPMSFLGKTYFTPLLKVVFTDATGKQDAVAWAMTDVAGMKRQIEELMQG